MFAWIVNSHDILRLKKYLPYKMSYYENKKSSIHFTSIKNTSIHFLFLQK